MNYSSSHARKNPSRETCEGIIKRILMTEVLENGKNRHFRSASDFMNYFQSLYPASDALTKQVQRAIKALDMPKDEYGYFIPNKTTEQLNHETELKQLFQKANISVIPMEGLEPLFLSADKELRSYLIHVLEHSPLFEGKFVTALETNNGIIVYTSNPNQLKILIESLIV